MHSVWLSTVKAAVTTSVSPDVFVMRAVIRWTPFPSFLEL